MTFNGLTDLSVDGVELHVTCHTMLLGRDPDQEKPLQRFVSTIVDDLAPDKTGVSVKHLQGLRFA